MSLLTTSWNNSLCLSLRLCAFAGDSLGLHLEPRQRPRRDPPHLDPEQNFIADRLADALRHVRGRCCQFYVYLQVRQCPGLIDLDAVLDDFRETAQDRLQGAGVEVVAAQVDHVVGPPEDATRQTEE